MEYGRDVDLSVDQGLENGWTMLRVMLSFSSGGPVVVSQDKYSCHRMICFYMFLFMR